MRGRKQANTRSLKRKAQHTGGSIRVKNAPGYMEKYNHQLIKDHSRDMALCMYYMFGIQLHRLYGFGAKRLATLYSAVDMEMKGFAECKFDAEELIKTLYDETGVDYRR